MHTYYCTNKNKNIGPQLDLMNHNIFILLMKQEMAILLLRNWVKAIDNFHVKKKKKLINN